MLQKINKNATFTEGQTNITKYQVSSLQNINQLEEDFNKEEYKYTNENNIGIDFVQSIDANTFYLIFKSVMLESEFFLEILIYQDETGKIYSIWGTTDDDLMQTWVNELIKGISLDISFLKEINLSIDENLPLWLLSKDLIGEKNLTEEIEIETIDNAQASVSEFSSISFDSNTLNELTERLVSALKERKFGNVGLVIKKKKDNKRVKFVIQKDYKLKVINTYTRGFPIINGNLVEKRISSILFIVKELLPELRRAYNQTPDIEKKQIELEYNLKCINQIFKEVPDFINRLISKTIEAEIEEFRIKPESENKDGDMGEDIADKSDEFINDLYENIIKLKDKLEEIVSINKNMTITTLFEYGLLKKGDKLIASHKEEYFSAEITTNGKLLYAGKEFDKPSDPGKLIYQKRGWGYGPSGWTFWKLQKEAEQVIPLDDLRQKCKFLIFKDKYKNNLYY